MAMARNASKLKVDIRADISIFSLLIFCLLNFGYRAIGTASDKLSLSKSIAITIR
jgi:hypothetical protein